MENEMTQREEMQRFAIDAGNETLEKMKGIAPYQSRSGELERDIEIIERNLDIEIIERNLRQSKHLLETAGESNLNTIIQMKQLVYLNSVMVEKYVPLNVPLKK